jgi:hypothetical protein
VDYDAAAEMLDVVLKEKLLSLVKGTHAQRIVERRRKLRGFGKWGQL